MEQDASVTIRNTFIEMRPEPVSSLRRSQSTPEFDLQSPRGKDLAERFADGMASPSKSSQASTDAFTDDSGTEEEGKLSDGARTPDVEQPQSMMLAAVLRPVPVPSESCRGRLRAGAKEWMPSIAQQSPPEDGSDLKQAHGQFHAEAGEVIEQVAAAVRKCGICVGVEVDRKGVQQSAQGCALTVVIQLEQVHMAERLATIAKQAIMAATHRSKGVRLLGRNKLPFARTPQGFIATFAAPPVNDSRACKFLYDGGFCRSGHWCRHGHPTSTMSLTFNMAVAGPQLNMLAQPQPTTP